MSDIHDRARELLPTVVITVLSMIQAIALELYWSRIQDSEMLWQGGWDAVIGWLQMAVILAGMLQIWLMYVGLLLRFSWLPTMGDTLIPFAIGLLEFSLIDLTGLEKLGLWFLVLASIFAIGVGATHVAYRRARQDPVNSAYFQQTAAPNWRDYLASMVMVGMLTLFGIVLSITDNRGLLAVGALAFALVTLLYQLYLTRRRWTRSAQPRQPSPER